MIRHVTLAALVWALSGPVMAQELVPVPEGCKPLATVHKNGCTVSTLFDCGVGKQVLSFHKGKPSQVHQYDANWGLRGFLYQANEQTRFDVKPNSGAMLKLKDLLAEEKDAESGILLFSSRVVKDREFVLEGAFELTGEEVTLDGHTFQQGKLNRAFEREGVEGSRLEFEFDILVSEELNLFIEGAVINKPEGREPVPIDHTPRSIRFEGDPGFLATMSEYGCTQ